MSLTKKDIEKIGKLARIQLSESDKDKFTTELNGIFNWIDMLKSVDTEGVSEMKGVGGYTMRTRDADEVKVYNTQDDIIKNAPKSAFGCYVVPKVVEG